LRVIFTMVILKSLLKKTFGIKDYQRFVVHRQILSPWRAEPDFIIAGVQKGGTTSLFKYLELHPDVATSFTKEAHFFNWSYEHGKSYYKAFFPLKAQTANKIVGESSPDYIDNPYVPERLAKMYPNIKLIFIFRNPAERAYSHYQMTCTFGSEIENQPFEIALDLEQERLKPIKEKMQNDPLFYDLKLCFYNYLEKGHYADQLRNWLKYFSRDQMLILKSEDLFADPESIYRQAEEFLGLSHHPLKDFKVYNSRVYSKIDPALRKRLEDYYQARNEDFYQLTGRRFWD
jgi:hypothetical protein